MGKASIFKNKKKKGTGVNGLLRGMHNKKNVLKKRIGIMNKLSKKYKKKRNI